MTKTTTTKTTLTAREREREMFSDIVIDERRVRKTKEKDGLGTIPATVCR